VGKLADLVWLSEDPPSIADKIVDEPESVGDLLAWQRNFQT